MKAIEKDRSRRYETANGLAMDVKRYLADEPVVAGPPSKAYRARKFIRRHRVAVTAAFLLAVILLAFGSGMAMLYLQSEANLSRALAAEQESSQISEFLLELFNVSNPEVARGEEITARQLLDEGARRIESELAGQPLLQARLMNTMGSAYRDLGVYEPSEELLRASLDRIAGREDEDPIFASNVNAGLAWLLTFLGRYDEAATHNLRSVEILRAHKTEYEEQISHHLANYSFTMLRAGNYELAEKLGREAYEIQSRVLDDKDPAKAVSLFHIGWALQGQMDYEGAEDYYLQALDLRLEAFGEDHPSVGWNLNNLGWLANQRGQYALSTERIHRALAVNRRLFDRIHPEIATNSHNLGVTYRNSGHYEVAAQLLERAVAMRRELLGDGHAWVAKALDHLARIELATGNASAAEARLLEALAVDDQGSREEIGWRRLHLAEALLAQGRLNEAHAEVSAAVADLEAAMPQGHWWIAQSRSVLGAVLTEMGRLDEAEDLLLDSFRTIDAVKQPGDIYAVDSLRRIVAFYEASGRPDEAASYRSLLDEELAAWRAQHEQVAFFANGAARRDLELEW
jgi:tetratricopeptide (TPR) repeat protein